MRSSTLCGSSSTVSPATIRRPPAAWSPPSASARTCRSTPRAGPSSTEQGRRAEQLDGKFVLTTNDDSLSAADIALGYKGMWIIEACFRKMKTTGLGIRPMSTDAQADRSAREALRAGADDPAGGRDRDGTPWSHLADVLERLKAVRYTAEGETIVQASRITPELAAILKKLDISKPKPILAVG